MRYGPLLIRMTLLPGIAMVPATFVVGVIMPLFDRDFALMPIFFVVYTVLLQLLAAFVLPKYIPRRGRALYTNKAPRIRVPSIQVPRAPERPADGHRVPSEAIDVAERGLAQLGIPKARADVAIKHALDQGCTTESTILREALRALA